MTVEERRSVATAMLEQVRINSDKTVVLVPRWSASTTVTFTNRGQAPALQPVSIDSGDASFTSPLPSAATRTRAGRT